MTKKKFKDAPGAIAALGGAVASLEDAARLYDVSAELGKLESQIYRERFNSTIQKISNAITACIEAQAALASFDAIFGDDGLATDGGGE